MQNTFNENLLPILPKRIKYDKFYQNIIYTSI